MDVAIAGGRITFRRSIAINATEGIPPQVDSDTPVNALVTSDDEITAGYVSLESGTLRIAAADLKITSLGRIWKIGWANVVIESSRRYHYDNGIIVTEFVDDVPTWDGGGDDEPNCPPFYGGDWYGTDEDDVDAPLGILQLNVAEDICFNDTPMMPPSYSVYESNGISLGKFEIERNVYMTRVSGYDRYMACLVVVNDLTTHEIAWSIPWDVTFNAQVAKLSPLEIKPVVTIDHDSLTRVNYGHNAVGYARDLVNQVLTKSGSQVLKRYTMGRET
jgi:hypothetical protein